MFKKGSYNVKKTEKKSSKKPKPSTSTESKPSTSAKTSTMTLKKKKNPEMTLKKKAEIKNVSNQESPEYRKKSYHKNVTSTKWVENKTFNKK